MLSSGTNNVGKNKSKMATAPTMTISKQHLAKEQSGVVKNTHKKQDDTQATKAEDKNVPKKG